MPSLTHPTLADLGFNPTQEQALLAVWGHPALHVAFQEGIATLSAHGLTPAQILDAKRHHLWDHNVVYFHKWDIPAHWIHLIVDNPFLDHMLRNEGDHVGWDDSLLDYTFTVNTVPFDVFINILHAATSHAGAWADVRRWVNAHNGTPTNPGETTATVEAEVATLAGLKPPLAPTYCPC